MISIVIKFHRRLFNAVAMALSFAAGTALAVDLPANYTRLDWIESTNDGKQYINTGYSPVTGTCIRASFNLGERSANWASLFGVFEKNDNSSYGVLLRHRDNWQHLNGVFLNSSWGDATVACPAGEDYIVELKSGQVTIGSTVTSITSLDENLANYTAPIYIFCECNRKNDSTFEARRHQAYRLYSMTIVEIDPDTGSETVKRNFIPCRTDGGANGLWDAVEGVFYGNQASGADFTGGIIYKAAANEKLTVQDASGTIELRGADAATSEVEVESAAAGAFVYVPNDSKRITIDSVGEGVKIIVRKIPSSDAPVTLALPAGQMIESLTIEDGLTVYLESGSVGSFEGTGKLVVQGVVGYGTISDGIDVKIEADASMSSILDDALASVLGDVPALWLDASDETTLQEYSYNGHTVPDGTFPGIVVRRWNDCREGEGRAFAVSARSATYYPSSEPDTTKGGYIRTMPFSIPNALNGLSVLSFGAYCETDEALVTGYRNAIDSNGNGIAENNRHEQRRMMFSRPIQSKSIIMVYGSQEGGGKGLVGGWKTSSADNKYPIAGEVFESDSSNTDTYYNRSDVTTASTVLAAGRKNVPCWVDGNAIVPNETAALNGGYQIISLGVAPGDSPSVRSIGMADQANNAGGQRYGEILIFTNELTTVQRKAVEFYLAKKWGLTAGYSAEASPKSLTVAEGGVFEAVDSALVQPHGAGTLAVGCDLDAVGVFSGNVTVSSGATLVVPASKDVLTEAAVDNISGRIARFDPDCEDDIEFGESSGMRMVYALFGHGNKAKADTPYLHGYYRSDDNDRRPAYSRGARGFGPERGWLDLNADPANHTVKGNNLRIKTDHSKAKTDSGDIINQSVKTVFIVMDSCHGGGLPVIDAGAPDGTTAVKARASYTDFTAPIWGSGTSGILTNGETRINGVAVDGTTTGFTGAPELFSFTTDGSVFNAGVFGYWNAGTDKAFEVLGEIVLFNEVLDAETRGGVEAYLMKKWLDTLPPGYVDWTGATVSGAGMVTAERPKDLPQFDNFTGTLEFTASTLAFTLDGATKTAAEAFDIGGATLKLPAEGVISLSFKDGVVKPGTYVLGSFGSIAEPGIEGWTYQTLASYGKHKIRVSAENGQLVVKVLSDGMMLIVW